MNFRLDSVVGTLHSPKTDLPRGTIIIDAVSKKFRKHTLQKKQSYSSLKTTFISRLFAKRFPKDNFVHALQELSIHVPAGSSLGVIGSNGSGKSTLLKLMAGIYKPDSGQVLVNGKISALIELGAGFHPDFTGRENVYLGGVMYGLTRKEIEARMDDIICYAELEDFIDDPVKTYSSGMYMRLGFSLAVHTNPDILLIDEVLAVGDASFIHRCHETISEFKRLGKTLIFVTHDLESVSRWCDEAIWLEKGVVKERGEPRWVIDSYLQNVQEGEEKELEVENSECGGGASVENCPDGSPGHPAAKRWGNRHVEITGIRLRGKEGEAKWIFSAEDSVRVEVDYAIHTCPEDLVFGVGILRADGLVVHGTNTEIDEIEVPLPGTELPQKGVKTGTYTFVIKRLGLVEDSYFLDVAAHGVDGTPYDYHHLRYRFSVRNHLHQQGVYVPEASWGFQVNYPVAQKELNKTQQRKVSGR